MPKALSSPHTRKQESPVSERAVTSSLYKLGMIFFFYVVFSGKLGSPTHLRRARGRKNTVVRDLHRFLH